MDVQDFLVCPESSCDTPSVEIDYYTQGDDEHFLTFNCTNCISSGSEDDLKWYVQCPYCGRKPHERATNELQTELQNGIVTIWCTNCDLTVSTRINTKWDTTT